ncbi:sulfotransferase family 2 domain-containing protein [Mangrovimonas aestuarii]|uniref:sulfotransferase family 2 domain-containing protein n=1 Tax=Mangrovimonas aestuarii TaxID=3018443 RepID=UPI00237896F1|nr:sulfotransferase family 2 domain-containing protein [Mangrovimonas aestuarii]
MIVSHKHKFIFIKPQKTAGTSVELLLSRICGPDDIITPLGYDPDPNVREKNNAKQPQNFKRAKAFKEWEMRDVYYMVKKLKSPNQNYIEHLTAQQIKDYVGDDIWNSYYKISIVRNPWDHAISMYEWMAKYNYEKVSSISFEVFLREKYRLLWPFYSVNNIFDIDFMLRFENLQDGINSLEEKFPLENLQLPVTKNKVRKQKNFSDYFDTGTKDLVREQNLNIIERFSYSFP